MASNHTDVPVTRFCDNSGNKTYDQTTEDIITSLRWAQPDKMPLKKTVNVCYTGDSVPSLSPHRAFLKPLFVLFVLFVVCLYSLRAPVGLPLASVFVYSVVFSGLVFLLSNGMFSQSIPLRILCVYSLVLAIHIHAVTKYHVSRVN